MFKGGSIFLLIHLWSLWRLIFVKICRIHWKLRIKQWNDFSEDTSVAESHGFNIMFWIFPTMVGNIYGNSPFTLICLYEQKWVTATKFGEKLANWPLAALLFIVLFQFDSQIHWTFLQFCFHRFPTLILSHSRYWWESQKSMKTKSYRCSMNLWIQEERNFGNVACI